MENKVKVRDRILALVLILCLVVTLIPDIGFAAESGSETNVNQIATDPSPQFEDVSEEDVVSKDTDSTTYDIGNGKVMTVFHGGDVRYENENGDLVDYDPSLVTVPEEDKNSDEYKYTNKEGDRKQYFPEILSEDTPILMENGENTVTFTPTDETLEANGIDNASVESEKEIVPTIYEEEKELKVNAVYSGDEDGNTFTYTSGDQGVKETITLSKKPESNIFTYKLKLDNNVVPKENPINEAISLFDIEKKEEVGFIDAPWMNDASGKAYSEDITLDIEKESDNQYLLTMTVSEDYLNAAERTYPVTIDPTFTWIGNDAVRDTYVISGNTYGNINFYDSNTSVMPAGVNKMGTHRTYIRFINLKAKVGGKSIYSAKFTAYERADGEPGQKIAANRILDDWKISDITWNNKPTYASSYLDAITTTNTARTAQTFNVLTFVKKVADGTAVNNGIVLRNISSTVDYSSFFGSRTSSTAYRPKLVVTYYSKPATPSSVTLTNKYVKGTGSLSVKWEGLTSEHLSSVQYKIDSGSYVKLKDATSEAGSGSISLDGKNLSEGAHKLYIRGVDAGGNYGGGKYVTFYVDNTLPIVNTITQSVKSTEASPIKPQSVKMTWRITETNVKSISYSVDSTAASDFVLTGNTALEGSFTVASSKLATTGTHVVRLKVIDKAGNTKTVTRSIYIDAVAPTIKTLKITPTSSETKPSVEMRPEITWSMDDTDIKSVSMKIDSGSYAQIGTAANGTYKIGSNKIVSEGKHTITIKAEDKAGNVSSTKSVTYWLDEVNIPLDDYEAKSFKAKSYYGKNILSWTATEKVPDGIFYRIYRSTTKGFTPSDSNRIVSKETGNYYVDMDVANGKTYYYRIEVVKFGKTGAVSSKISTVTESSATSNNILKSEEGRTGETNWLSYFTFDVPTGDGSIEKSKGNLMYSQSDFDLTGDNLEIGLTRTYNSKLNIKGMLGNGWSDSYHEEIIKKGTDYQYIDSTGAVYEIKKASTGYECTESKRIKFKTLSNAEDAKFEIRTDDREILKFNRFGQLISRSDYNDNVVVYSYDSLGRLAKIKAADKTLTLNYLTGTSDSYLDSIILPDKTLLKYTYTSGNLTSVTHSAGTSKLEGSATYRFGYTGNLMTSIKDAEGYEYIVSYDSNGNAVDVTYPNDDKYTLSRSTSGDIITCSLTKKNGSSTIYTEKEEVDKNTGKLLKYTDSLGNITTYAYGYVDNPLLMTNSSSDKEYEVIENGEIKRLSKKVTTAINYTDDELIESETDEDGVTTDYTYEDGTEATEGLVKNETESVNGKTISDITYEYDNDGNTTLESESVVDSETRMTYDGDGNVETETEKEKNLTTSTSSFGYDNNGNQEKATTKSADLTNTETAEYDLMGRVTKKTIKVAAGDEVTTYTYDALGRVLETKITYADGTEKTSTNSYDDNGTVVAETDINGVKKGYSYDDIGRLTSTTVTSDAGVTTSTTSYSYDTLNGKTVYKEVKSENNGTNSTTSYIDGSGRTKKEITDDIVTEFTYDKSGNKLSEKTYGASDSSKSRLTAYATDINGNEIAVIENPNESEGDFAAGDNSIATFSTYDDKGNLTSNVDGKGIKTTYSYDDENRLISIIEDAGGSNSKTSTISYTENEAEETVTTSYIDAKGNKLETVQDAAGQVIYEKNIGTGSNEIITTEYGYDKFGRKKSVSYSNGAEGIFSYNKKGQLISSTYQYEGEEQGLKTEYTYDDKDHLVKMIDSNIAGEVITPHRYTYYSYDGLGRQISKAEVNAQSEPSDDEISNTKLTYSYDSAGKLVEVRYPEKVNGIDGLKYDYDNLGKISSIKAISGLSKKEIQSYTYDSLGQVVKASTAREFEGFSADKIDTSYEYDTFGRTTKISYIDGNEDTVKESYEYAYDKNSNITLKKALNTWSSDANQQVNEDISYTYDNLGRLVKSDKNDKIKESNSLITKYEYDNAGNRTKVTSGSDVTNYSYNGLNQLTSYVKTDSEGTEKENVVCTYDNMGNLLNSSDSITGNETDNSYDALGRLSTTSITENGNEKLTQHNTYNGDGQRISKDVNGDVKDYFYDGTSVLYTMDGNDASNMEVDSLNIYGATGSIIARQNISDDSANTYLYTQDMQGSTMSTLDSNLSAKGIYHYTDYGETAELKEDTTGNEICYTGGIYDKDTGEYYLNARYYDPETAVFLAADSYRGEAETPNSWNVYGYCVNNPIKYIDPSGHHISPLYWNSDQKYFAYYQDAPQKKLGFYDIYDYAANLFGMELEWLTFQTNKWKLEFWKGQYGEMYGGSISSGCEIGLYYKDGALWKCAYQKDRRIRMKMSLYKKGYSRKLFDRDSKYTTVQKKAWWLTAFKPADEMPAGVVASAKKLRMEGTIWFNPSNKKYRKEMKKIAEKMMKGNASRHSNSTGSFYIKGEPSYNKVSFVWNYA